MLWVMGWGGTPITPVSPEARGLPARELSLPSQVDGVLHRNRRALDQDQLALGIQKTLRRDSGLGDDCPAIRPR